MSKLNCWEVKNCGREPGGKNASNFGVCPAINSIIHDGINKGYNGGRFCWAVAGTLCEGEPSGTFADKFVSCINCEFFKNVNDEEGSNFIF